MKRPVLKQTPQRDPTTGRFLPGNAGGPGRSFGQRVSRFRSMLLEAVTDEDYIAIVKKLIEDAKLGDSGARSEFFNRVLGKCLESDVLEMIEELKGQLAEIKNRR
jgi:hypothetical protein